MEFFFFLPKGTSEKCMKSMKRTQEEEKKGKTMSKKESK